MSEAARIDLVDRAPLTEKQQNVYESIMQYQKDKQENTLSLAQREAILKLLERCI